MRQYASSWRRTGSAVTMFRKLGETSAQGFPTPTDVRINTLYFGESARNRREKNDSKTASSHVRNPVTHLITGSPNATNQQSRQASQVTGYFLTKFSLSRELVTAIKMRSKLSVLQSAHLDRYNWHLGKRYRRRIRFGRDISVSR